MRRIYKSDLDDDLLRYICDIAKDLKARSHRDFDAKSIAQILNDESNYLYLFEIESKKIGLLIAELHSQSIYTSNRVLLQRLAYANHARVYSMMLDELKYLADLNKADLIVVINKSINSNIKNESLIKRSFREVETCYQLDYKGD